jgi:threonine/homoserine/homoserine lactone efflux protein
MTFLPAASVLLAYSLACFVLFITPGPDMSLALAKTVAGGRRAGMASMLGAQTGACIHALLAALGLSALLAASATAFTALKIVGAVYLLWLAVDAIRHGSSLNVRSQDRMETPVWRTFLLGFGVNLTNPKVVLFYTLPLFALLVLGAERVIGWLKNRQRVLRAIDYVFAGLFGAFAVKILTAEGR